MRDPAVENNLLTMIQHQQYQEVPQSPCVSLPLPAHQTSHHPTPTTTPNLFSFSTNLHQQLILLSLLIFVVFESFWFNNVYSLQRSPQLNAFMKEFNIQADFPVSVSQFLDLFFLSSKFKLDFHVARGDTEISVGDWKELGNNKFERAIKFCSQVSDQVILKKLTGGISPVVHEKQDYEFVDKTLHVSSLATSSAGGFNCATTADYTITEPVRSAGVPHSISNGPSGPHGLNGLSGPNGLNGFSDGCHVDIVVKSEFKSRLFKGQVETMMNQAATQTFDQWLLLIKNKISDFHKEEQQRLRQKHVQPPPLPLPIPDYLTDTLSSASTTADNSEYDTDEESYYDAPDHLTSPPSSGTTTPIPTAYRSVTPPPPTHHALSTMLPSTTTTTSTNTSLPVGGLSALVQSMHKELQQVRSMTEVNSARLLGLEAAKLASTSTSTPSTSTSPFPLASPAPSLATHNEGLLPYLQRLDLLVKQQEEEGQRNKDKEQEWRRKLEEMEARMEGMNGRGGGVGGGIGRMVPGGWWGVMVFLLVWPVMAQKLWKYAKVLHPMAAQMFWRMIGR